LTFLSSEKHHYSPRPNKTDFEKLIPRKNTENITRLSVNNIEDLIANHKSSTNMRISREALFLRIWSTSKGN